MKTNLIFILTDDQGAWALGANGNRDIHTPNLDKLATLGNNIQNFFCSSPVCSPARASILTGKIPSSHGVCDWIKDGNFDHSKYHLTKNNNRYKNENNAINYLDNETCYTDILAKHGYNCSLVGKWHLGNSFQPQHGFNKWITIPIGHSHYINPDIIENQDIHMEEGYVTDILTDKAIKSLNELSKDDKPFYLSIHYNAPHTPWNRNNHPSYVHDEYNGYEFSSIPNTNMHKDSIYTCESPYFGAVNSNNLDDARKELISGYYGAITQVDKGVGRILEEVNKLKLSDNTYIIFTSDNGMNLGQHGVWGKGNGTYPQNMYDTSVKVPFIIYGPNISSNNLSSLYNQYDIFPTILDLLNVKLDKDDEILANTLPGKSFKGCLFTNEEKQDNTIYIYSEYGKVRMLRTKKYKFVKNYINYKDELYDIENDVNEENNLIDDPNFYNIVKEYNKNIEDWFNKYSQNKNLGLIFDNFGTGQTNTIASNENSPFFKGNCIESNYLEFVEKLKK